MYKYQLIQQLGQNDGYFDYNCKIQIYTEVYNGSTKTKTIKK